MMEAVLSMDMPLISRLRNDADLRSLYQGAPTGKKQRPKKYAGKIDVHNIDNNSFAK